MQSVRAMIRYYLGTGKLGAPSVLAFVLLRYLTGQEDCNKQSVYSSLRRGSKSEFYGFQMHGE
jgi:hypothetical protein